MNTTDLRTRLQRQTHTAEPQPGRVLATFPRKDGQELRVTLDSFNGRPFLNARLWFTADDGTHRPTKKGITVGSRDLRAFAGAILDAIDEIDGETGGAA